MILIEGKLYLTPDNADIDYHKMIVYRGRPSSGWLFYEDELDGLHVQYDSLKPKYQLAILKKHNTADIYAWYEANKFEAALKADSEAISFFHRFRFENDKEIPSKRRSEYIAVAKVLAYLAKTYPPLKPAAKQALVADALAYIAAKKVQLPTNKDRLLRRMSAYISRGYYSIINGRFCNQNSLKAKNEELIRQLAARPQNMDFEIHSKDYNQYALQAGLPTLHRATIQRYAEQAGQQILGAQQGMHAWRNTHDIVVPRKRPTSPLLLSVHDGFDWELYYQKRVKDNNGHQVTRHHFRKNVIMVVDAFNDYPLGYAIGDGETIVLIKEALRNAMLHIAELTGGYYLPWQVKSDNWALSPSHKTDLHLFYERIGKYVTPAKVGNARDKTIESWFSRVNNKYTCRELNYAGKNADALKSNQPNRDFLDKHKADFPDEAGVIWQIGNIIEQDRATKREAWLNAWEATPLHLKRPVDRLQYLQTFGERRKRSVQLTNQGIVMTHQGVKRTYILLEHDFIQHIGSDIHITCDPATPESIMAADEKKRLSWLVSEANRIPMALMDMKEGDRTNLNEYLNLKDEVEQLAIAANTADMTKLEAEGLTKGYFTYGGANKGQLAQAKRVLGERTETKELVVVNESEVEIDMQLIKPKKGSLKVID